MADIGSLDIRITAAAKTANDAINSIVAHLQTLNGALANFSDNTKFKTGLDTLVSGLTELRVNLDGLDPERTKGVTKALKDLAKAGEELSKLNGLGTFSSSAADSGSRLIAVSSKAMEQAKKIADDYNITDKAGINELAQEVENLYASVGDDDAIRESMTHIEELIRTYARFRNELHEMAKANIEAIRSTHGKLNSDWVEHLGGDYESARRNRGILGISNTSKQGANAGTIIGENTSITGIQESANESENLARALEIVEANAEDARNAMVGFDEVSESVSGGIAGIRQTVDELVSSLGLAADKLREVSSSMSTEEDDFMNIDVPDDDIAAYAQAAQTAIPAIEELNSAAEDTKAIGNPFEGLLIGLRGLENVNLSESLSRLTVIKDTVSKIGGESGARAGESLTQIANGIRSFEGVVIPEFGDKLTTLSNGLRSLGSGNIVKASTSLAPIAAGLRELSGIVITADVEKVASLAHAISRFGLANMDKSVKNIPQLATAMRGLITSLANVPQVSDNTIRLVEAMSKMNVNSLNANNGVTRLSSGLRNYHGHAMKAQRATKGLAVVIGKIYASYWLLFRLFSKFGQAIDLASQLKEVQNVVDVTFADMNEKMNDFAKNAVDTLGMSELTAKQMGSKFQAMGSAMGISKEMVKSTNDFVQTATKGYADVADSMADISINLTRLAGDMASFYNQDYEEVAERLQAVFTGQTRPLRQYGIDLTQATLKEWALKNGLDADIKSMTQAEKTLLRYQYVMAQTTASHGDFERTIGTWANQIRIAQERLKQLGIVLGQIAIYSFKPLVVSFNKAMAQIIKAAEGLLNALGKIFGWKIEWSDSGILRDDEEAAGDLADDMGDAADNAKKFKNFLLGIDELNLLPDNSDKNKGDSGLGGLGDLWGDLDGGLKITPIEKGFESLYDTLYKLGKKIADVLKNLLKGIDWDYVYKRARRFGRDIGEFLNGLFSDAELFYEIGKFIAGGVNTIANAIDSLFHEINGWQIGKDFGNLINGFTKNLDWNVIRSAAYEVAHDIAQFVNSAMMTIDWKMVGSTVANGFNTVFDFFYTIGSEINWHKVGKSISDSINGFFDTFDFELAADTINAWSIGILDALYEALDNVNWNKVGKRIGDFLRKLNVSKIVAGLSKVLVKAFEAAVDVIASAFGSAPLETALLGAIALVNTKTVGSAFSSVLKSGLGLVDLKAVSGTLTGALSGIMPKLLGGGAGFAEFFVIKDTFKDLYQGAENFSNALIKIGGSAVAAGAAMTAVFGFPAGAVAAAVIAVTGEIVGMTQAMMEAYQEAERLDFAAFLSNGGVGIDDYFTDASNALRDTYDDYEKLSRKVEETDFEGMKKAIAGDMKEIGESINILGDSLNQNEETVKQSLERIEGLFESFKEDVSKLFSEEVSVIEEAALNGMVENGAQLTAAANDIEYATLEAIQGIYDKIAETQTLFDEGKIPYEEYRGQLQNYYDKLNAIYAETTNEGIDKLSEASSKIDFSKFLLGEEDVNSVKASLEAYSVVFTDATHDISVGYDGLFDALRDIGERAAAVGDTENAALFAQAIIDGQAKEVELIANANQEYIGRIEELEKQAWSELGHILSNPEHLSSMDVAQRAQDYITNVLQPLEDAITEETGKVGVAWSSGIKDMSKKLYDEMNTSLSGLQIDGKQYGTDLFSLWNDKYSKAAENGQKSIKGLAKEQSDAEKKAESFAKSQGVVTDSLKTSSYGYGNVNRAMKGLVDTNTLAINGFTGLNKALSETNTNGKNIEQVSNGFKAIGTSVTQFVGQLPLFQSSFGNVSTSMKENIMGIDTSFTKMYFDVQANGVKMIAWFKGAFIPMFGASYWNGILSGIPVAFQNAFTLAVNNAKNIWMNFAKWANENMKMSVGTKNGGKQDIELKFPTYAKGGFPEDGMFFANHTEMVGQFANGKTAVANNDQIVQGIENGVYNAVSAAMKNLVVENNIELRGDAADFFTAMVNENNRSIMRTGRSPIRV